MNIAREIRSVRRFFESQHTPWDQCAFDVHEAYTAAMDGFKRNGIENTWIPFSRKDLTDVPEKTGENLRILCETLDLYNEKPTFSVCMKDILGNSVIQFVADFGQGNQKVVEIESRKGDVSIRSYDQFSYLSSGDLGAQRKILGIRNGADGKERAERLYLAAMTYLDFTIVRAEAFLEKEAFDRIIRPEIPLDVMDVQTVWT